MLFQKNILTLHYNNEYFNINNMIKYNYYNQEKELDRVWFDSSNILYGECDDSSNSQEKNVTLVFKGGIQYLYKNVNIGDWMDFKMSQSQGKALNEIFKAKGYEYCKLEERVDLEKLENEFVIRSNNGVYMEFVKDEDSESDYLKVINCKDDVILYTNAEKYSARLDIFINDVIKIYKGLGYHIEYSKEIQKLLNNNG